MSLYHHFCCTPKPYEYVWNNKHTKHKEAKLAYIIWKRNVNWSKIYQAGRGYWFLMKHKSVSLCSNNKVLLRLNTTVFKCNFSSFILYQQLHISYPTCTDVFRTDETPHTSDWLPIGQRSVIIVSPTTGRRGKSNPPASCRNTSNFIVDSEVTLSCPEQSVKRPVWVVWKGVMCSLLLHGGGGGQRSTS